MCACRDNFASLLHFPSWLDPDYARHRKGGQGGHGGGGDRDGHGELEHGLSGPPATMDNYPELPGGFTALRASSSGSVPDVGRGMPADAAAMQQSQKGWTNWPKSNSPEMGPQPTPGVKAGAWGKPAVTTASSMHSGGAPESSSASTWATRTVSGPAGSSNGAVSPGAKRPLGVGPTGATIVGKKPGPGSATKAPGGRSEGGEEEADGWQTVSFRR
jgi:hypothetical protein